MVAPLIALAVVTGASLLAPYVGREVAKQTQPAKVQRELEKREVQEAIQEAVGEVSRAQPGVTVGPLALTTYDIPGAPAYFAGEVQKKAEQKLKARGYSAEEAREIAAGAGAVTTGGGVGEAVGVLGISAGAAGAATKIGAKGVTQITAKQAGKIGAKQLTRQVTKASAVAGVYEGVGTTGVSTLGREGRLPTAQEALFGGVAGGATAAVGGYALTRAYLRGPKTGKVADWLGSSLIDPYEKPGDVLAGLKVKGPKLTKVGGKKVKGPVLTVTPTPAQVTPSPVTPSPVPTPAITPAITPAQTPTETPVETPTPEPTPEPTPPTPAETPTETPVVTPTTPVTVPVLSSTIQPRMLPAPPLLPAPPGADFGAVRKGALTYYNEFRQAAGLTRKMLAVR
jgi:hypothetical protein